MTESFTGNEKEPAQGVFSRVTGFSFAFFFRGLSCSLILLCMVLFSGCDQAEKFRKELARVREEHAQEINEINRRKEIQIKQSYEKGREAGIVEGLVQGLDEQGQELFLRGRAEGYKEGLAEGEVEIKIIREKHKDEIEKLKREHSQATGQYRDLSGEVSSLKSKLQKAENEVKTLREQNEKILAERADLMNKLRAAIKRIDLYELETREREGN